MLDSSAEATSNQGTPPDKWGVLVVHGVGDTRPGATLDTLISGLSADSPPGAPLRLHCKGGVIERRLEDHEEAPDPLKPSQLVCEFPVHMREADVAVPGLPQRAIFAEVFWADLSTVREGNFGLLVGVIQTVFTLRFIARWAGDLDHFLAKVMRLLLYCAAWLLCAPIAALSVLLALLTAVHFLVPSADRWKPPNDSAGFGPDDFSVCVTSGLGLLMGWVPLLAIRDRWGAKSRLCDRWGTMWSHFFMCLTVFSGLLGAAVALRYAQSQVWETFLVSTIGTVNTAQIANYLTLALRALLTLLMAFDGLVLIACVLGLSAWVGMRFKNGAAITAAIGATLLQLGLWTIIAPVLGLVAIHSLLNSETQKQLGFFEDVWRVFSVHAVLAFLFVLIVLSVWFHRSSSVFRNPTRFSGADGLTEVRRVPRLIANRWIFVGLFAIAGIGITLSILRVIGSPSWISNVVPAGWVTVITTIAAGVVTYVIASFSKGLRDWVHIVMDVINHFYHRIEGLPWRKKGEPPVKPAIFEIQQRIERRFTAVLKELVQQERVTHLTVVSHSQGTMVAIDVLAGKGAWRLLKRVRHVHLVTMASPLTHLYQFYFPTRYASLTRPKSWTVFVKRFGGQFTNGALSRRWHNVFRADDFIGLDVEPFGSLSDKDLNLPVSPGGHTDYWNQREVTSRLWKLFPFPAIKQPVVTHVP